jgi:putative hydrolase of the HAD superfamily
VKYSASPSPPTRSPAWRPRRRRRRSRSPTRTGAIAATTIADAATEYWQSVLADARAASRQADDIERLIALDVRSWTGYREEVWTLAEQQRAAGVRTAVLSNGVPEIMEVIERERAISTKFDTVVVSYEVGCAKPDAEIFELTLDRLGVAAAHALFVDDREVNLEGARRVGLRTLHFTGPTP